MKLKRSIHYETLADFGNGVKLESYWPERNPEPFFYVRQGASGAPIKRGQLRPLIEALEELESLMWEND